MCSFCFMNENENKYTNRDGVVIYKRVTLAFYVRVCFRLFVWTTTTMISNDDAKREKRQSIKIWNKRRKFKLSPNKNKKLLKRMNLLLVNPTDHVLWSRIYYFLRIPNSTVIWSNYVFWSLLRTTRRPFLT